QLSEIFYTIEVQIGSPPQTIQINLDTGSSETWFNPYCDGYANYESTLERMCRAFGIYLPEQSESVVDMNGTYIPRTITYGSGAVLVRYFKDDVYFSENFTVKQPLFGVAEWSFNLPTGILGAAMGMGYNQDYPSLIDEMYEQGLIRDKDFSVALGSVSDEHGEVIFGGIDKGKFTGPLRGVKIARQLSDREDVYFRYWINLTQLSISEPGSCGPVPITNTSFLPLRVLVDTGTTLTYLPYDIIDAVLLYFPDYTYGFQGYEIPCSYMDQPGAVNFAFDGIVISVPYKDFVFKSPPLEEFNYTSTCYLGVYAGYGDFYVLGDTFLRSAYVTFRQQTQTVFLAQGADCGTNI
ncbi:acid protease, partial [Thozetella sp. PMI_491]